MATTKQSAGGKVKNKEVIFAAFPKGWVQESNLQVKENEMELSVEKASGDVIVKTMYISLDPYYRDRMNQNRAGYYLGTFKIGEPLEGGVVGKVIVSDNNEFKVGDVVVGGLISFGEYAVIPGGKDLQKIDITMVPPSYYLGVCGMPGMTAYVGLKLIGRPKKGDQVFVTAASGAVGQVVGQLAKVYGCRVVGSAGTDDKVELLKAEFGYNDAFNYKKEKDLDAALSKYAVLPFDDQFVCLMEISQEFHMHAFSLLKHNMLTSTVFGGDVVGGIDAWLLLPCLLNRGFNCVTVKRTFPNGIDIYFDNVGGEMLEAVLNHMNVNGRIPLCGAMSQSNKEWHEQPGVRNLPIATGKCLTLQGFIGMGWYAEHFGAFIEEVSGYLREGKVKYKEHVTEGMENLPAAFVGMMKGENVGKAVVHVAD